MLFSFTLKQTRPAWAGFKTAEEVRVKTITRTASAVKKWAIGVNDQMPRNNLPHTLWTFKLNEFGLY
jgi:hypothetical protein